MLLLPLLLASSAAAATDLPPVRTSRPVIGILTQPTDVDKSYNLSSYGSAYLVASYVRWVESAGARAVPVPWSASKEELREIFLTTNGILFPGGGTSLSGHGGPEGVAYKAAGATLFALAKAANDAGTVYPIWGTCLGFEEVMELSVNSTSVLRRTTGTDPMLAPVTLTAAATQSKLLAASPSTRDALENSGNVSIHLHGFGVYLDTFTPNGLSAFWEVLGTNIDAMGTHFVSLAEAHHYPFFASQFHPEKNAYEWEQGWCEDAEAAAAAHSRAATDAMHNLVGTFVDWARRNPHVPADDSKIIPGGWEPKALYTGGGLIPPKNMETWVFNF